MVLAAIAQNATSAARTIVIATAMLIKCALSFESVALAQGSRPDALTVSATGGVDLCRPQGSCFRPEPNDPIFFRDEIKTHLPGRLEFNVRGTRG